MKHHFKYAGYLIRHKWFVLLAGFVLGAPMTRLVLHDASKLRPDEWGPYARRFNLPKSADPAVNAQRKADFNEAWEKHWRRNDHHWEFWCDENGKNPRPMPPKVILEMIADWMGAGRAITGGWEVWTWYDANKHKIELHPDTRRMVESIIDSYRPIDDWFAEADGPENIIEIEIDPLDIHERDVTLPAIATAVALGVAAPHRPDDDEFDEENEFMDEDLDEFGDEEDYCEGCGAEMCDCTCDDDAERCPKCGYSPCDEVCDNFIDADEEDFEDDDDDFDLDFGLDDEDEFEEDDEDDFYLDDEDEDEDDFDEDEFDDFDDEDDFDEEDDFDDEDDFDFDLDDEYGDDFP